MSNIKNNVVAQETRRKLLKAAGELFAERGVYATTIKQITDKAGVAIAAVNYHFRDKFELYAAVIRSLMEVDACQIVPTDLGGGSAPERLRRFVQHFLKSILRVRNSPAWKGLLLARELTQPTTEFKQVVEAVLGPLIGKLEPLVQEILGERAPAEKVHLHVNSILGQCFYYVNNRAAIEWSYPHLLREGCDLLADHIVDFSLAALTRNRGGQRCSATCGTRKAGTPGARAGRHASTASST
jgi:AcrR family transcriptional regulator